MFKRIQKTFGLLLIALAVTTFSFASWETVEKEIDRQVRIHPEFQHLNLKVVAWDSAILLSTGQYNDLYGKFGISSYEPSTGTVRVSENAKTYNILHNISHEAGHDFWFKTMTRYERTKYTELAEKYGLSPSEIGRGYQCETFDCVVAENFAEFYSLMRYHTTNGMYQDAYEYLKDSPQGKFVKLLIQMHK